MQVRVNLGFDKRAGPTLDRHGAELRRREPGKGALKESKRGTHSSNDADICIAAD